MYHHVYTALRWVIRRDILQHRTEAQRKYYMRGEVET
ncbi:hypothetical protein EYZ11_007466 [Aspergillus tanneri]|uniref:Uncharacterized protein n=1 Tax=Aspergillus tanneri TaxID=1220188 RepID=A0A4S3JCY5_9EURO|nr:hypothetical protein EYZ11_007466 [Aspergillus tanneri]